VLGAVVGGGDGREGAWVFFRRVQTSSDRLGLDAAIVLGDAVAHEIGHLLLPRGTHSASGLMRAAWTDEDLLLAVRGQLGFTETEARVIKDAILLRPSSLVPGPSVVPGSASSPGLTVQVSAIAAPRRAEN
jgi:hypothetical protein